MVAFSAKHMAILGVVILLSIFGSGILTYRSMFLQVKQSGYIEAARAYGASNARIIFRYMVPKVIPVLIPQFVAQVPNYVFLEATLAVLGLGDPVLPTWGKLLNDAYTSGALFNGHYYWVLEPAFLLVVTGLGFAMLGFALDGIFNPRLRVIDSMKSDIILDVRDLKLHFRTRKGPVQAVDGVTFQLKRGQTLAVVGESGCGKTSLVKAILRLLPRNIETFTGEVFFNGVDVMKYNDERFRKEIRWTKMAMVPQASMNSLNPVIRIEDQIAEPLFLHEPGISREKAMQRVAEVFKVVGLPLDFLQRYPLS